MKLLDRHFGSLYWVWLGVLGVLGVWLSLLATSTYGVGISNDSADYIAAARKMSADETPKRYRAARPTGEIPKKISDILADSSCHEFVHWPPLFPAILALITILTGIDPAVSGRFVNGMSFGGIIICSGILFAQAFPNRRHLHIIGPLLVVTGLPLLAISTFFLTEILFTLLSVLFLITLIAYMHRMSWGYLLASAA